MLVPKFNIYCIRRLNQMWFIYEWQDSFNNAANSVFRGVHSCPLFNITNTRNQKQIQSEDFLFLWRKIDKTETDSKWRPFFSLATTRKYFFTTNILYDCSCMAPLFKTPRYATECNYYSHMSDVVENVLNSIPSTVSLSSHFSKLLPNT